MNASMSLVVRARLFAMLTLTLLALPMLFEPASAQVKRWLQPDSVPPLKKMYNVPPTEFTIGSFSAPEPAHDSSANYWPWLHAMGVNLLAWMPIADSNAVKRWDTLAATRVDTVTERFVPAFIYIPGLASYPVASYPAVRGQQAVFYPFDSVQSPSWKCQFTSVQSDPKGQLDTSNTTMGHKREVIYDSTGTTLRAGDSVAWGIIYRWPRPDTLAFDSNYTFITANRAIPTATHYVAVTGHLFSTGTADSTTPVLQIKVVYMIDSGQTYIGTDDSSHIATSKMEVAYATINVLKDSLTPTGPGLPNFNTYRTASFPVNLDKIGSTYGPVHSGNQSHRFDLRVFWTGAEKVALRCVILRDSIGEMMLGHRPESDSYRDTLIKEARRMIYGPNFNDSARLKKIFYIESAHEPPFSQAAAYAALDSMLKWVQHEGAR